MSDNEDNEDREEFNILDLPEDILDRIILNEAYMSEYREMEERHFSFPEKEEYLIKQKELLRERIEKYKKLIDTQGQQNIDYAQNLMWNIDNLKIRQNEFMAMNRGNEDPHINFEISRLMRELRKLYAAHESVMSTFGRRIDLDTENIKLLDRYDEIREVFYPPKPSQMDRLSNDLFNKIMYMAKEGEIEDTITQALIGVEIDDELEPDENIMREFYKAKMNRYRREETFNSQIRERTDQINDLIHDRQVYEEAGEDVTYEDNYIAELTQQVESIRRKREDFLRNAVLIEERLKQQKDNLIKAVRRIEGKYASFRRPEPGSSGQPGSSAQHAAAPAPAVEDDGEDENSFEACVDRQSKGKGKKPQR